MVHVSYSLVSLSVIHVGVWVRSGWSMYVCVIITVSPQRNVSSSIVMEMSSDSERQRKQLWRSQPPTQTEEPFKWQTRHVNACICTCLCVCVCVFLKKQKHNMHVCRCVCVCVRARSHTVCTRVRVCGSCVSVAGLPVMIDPDSVSPCWRISVALNACYHGNRLPAHRSGTQTIVSLPLSPRPLLYPLFIQFSLPHPPPLYSHSFLFPALIFIHSCQSSLAMPPLLFSFSLVSFTLTFFTSLNSFMSTLLPCSHISVHSSHFIIFTGHVIIFFSLSFHPSMCTVLHLKFSFPLYSLSVFMFPVLYFSQTGSTRWVHQWTVLNMCTLVGAFLGSIKYMGT